jgi:hypothetical protein
MWQGRQMAWLEAAERGLRQMSLRTRIVASAAIATASFLIAPSALAASHLSGTNDPVSAGLMLKFINRVAKLR